ncbi:TPA: F-box protein, partial [Legionella pneumophila]
LIAQYNKVNKEGVTYRLNGKTITEKHFDFKNTIIKELKTQVDSINAPGARNWDAIDKQWREGVGGAQKLLPMHVVYEYCSNEPFYRVPKFTSQPKSSKQFFNWVTEKDENWFGVDSKLGSELAIFKVFSGGCASSSRYGGASTLDLVALKALCEVRTKDFIDLKSQLEEQASLDNHYQIVPM